MEMPNINVTITNSLEDYNNNYDTKFEELNRTLFSNMVMFELTKCCGYGSFMPVYRSSSLQELYSTVRHHFSLNRIDELYIVSNMNNEKIQIPMMEEKTVGEYIRECVSNSPPIISPIYGIPHPVVYKLYVDDGHTHTHTHNENEVEVNNVLYVNDYYVNDDSDDMVISV